MEKNVLEKKLDYLLQITFTWCRVFFFLITYFSM
jgi:hypothetical protein